MISIDPLTHIITVPQSDLNPLGGSNYQHDTTAFRIQLKNWEDSEDGIYQPKTHNHNTVAVLGGLQYARMIEILSPYTITYEDVGVPYKVFLAGSNNNILDVTNLNNVSVASNNSAGLVQTREIEHMAFGEVVHYKADSGYVGITYPNGTYSQPVNNLTDTQTIAVGRGFDTIHVIGNMVVGAAESISGYTLHGTGIENTIITLTSGCTTSKTTFEKLSILGRQSGETHYYHCEIRELTNVHCEFVSCRLVGPLRMHKSYADTTILDACYGNAIIDLDDSPCNMNFTGYNGELQFQNMNKATAGTVHIHGGSGVITIDSTCTTGTIRITGDYEIIDNSNGTVIEDMRAGISKIDDLHDEALEKWEMDTSTTPHQMIYYKADGVTELRRFNVLQDSEGKYIARIPV